MFMARLAVRRVRCLRVFHNSKGGPNNDEIYILWPLLLLRLILWLVKPRPRTECPVNVKGYGFIFGPVVSEKRLRTFFTILFFFCLVHTASAEPPPYNVLLVSLSFRGHVVPLQRLSAELSSRGHRITFAAHEDAREMIKRIDGVEFISLGKSPLPIDHIDTKKQMEHISSDSSFLRGILTLFNDVYLPLSKSMYKTLLEKTETISPDVMVIDIGALAGLDVAQRLNIPYVINSPSLMFGLSRESHYLPAWGSGFSLDMTIWERCLSMLFPKLLAVSLTPTFMELNSMRRERGLSVFPSQDAIFDNSPVMINTAFGFEFPHPVSPLTFLVGPLLPGASGESTSNDKSLSTFLAKHEGQDKDIIVVYFSKGGMSYLEISHVNSLVKAVRSTNKRSVWVFPKSVPSSKGEHSTSYKESSSYRDSIKKIPRHLYVEDISPARLLALPEVKLVVSACGMAIAQESLVSGKPLLCIPVLADQIDVSARVVGAGAGLSLDKTDFDFEEAVDKLRNLTQQSSFAQCAGVVGNLLEHAGGTRRAANIVQQTISPGVEHLRDVSRHLSWHQRVHLDAVAVLVATVCILSVILRTFWQIFIFFVRLCFRRDSVIDFKPIKH